jgi:hypothetical protein
VIYSDYKGDTRVFGTITASGGGKFTSTSAETSVIGNVPVYREGEKPPVTAYISGPGGAAIGYAYELVGNQDVCCETTGDITWAFDRGTINQSGVITSLSGCGTGTITATSCGTTYSKQVTMPAGAWVLISSEGSYIGTAPPQEFISGGNKVVEYYECGCRKYCANTMTIREFSYGHCFDTVVCTHYGLYSPSLLPIGPPQVPTLDAICEAQSSPCSPVTSYEIAYQCCDGDVQIPEGCTYTVTEESGLNKAVPVLREHYEWRCP